MDDTIACVAKKNGDRHKHPQLNLRLHSLLRKQLEKLADRNVTTMTAEATAAIREYLAKHGLWPPSQTSG